MKLRELVERLKSLDDMQNLEVVSINSTSIYSDDGLNVNLIDRQFDVKECLHFRDGEMSDQTSIVCPFCGSELHHVVTKRRAYKSKNLYYSYTACGKCHARGPVISNEAEGVARNEADRLWQTRGGT